jgi:SAM-dependent methyltransferase
MLMNRPQFWTAQVETHDEYSAFINFMGDELDRHHQSELSTFSGKQPFILAGHCGVCKRDANFSVTFEHSGGRDEPNWREHLNCEWCTLNNRMRAAVQMAEKLIGPKPNASVYITEQITPLYDFFKKTYPQTIGSEFLNDSTLPGKLNKKGVRFEDLTRLSFDDSIFDAILSFDVLEHIPEYKLAISEVHRSLKPGGVFLWSAPFDYGFPQDTLIRASMGVDGNIAHHLPPEYHGDPLSDGVLCFQHFGFDVIDDMRRAGFASAAIHFYWSIELAYLGGLQYLVCGKK